MYNKTFRLEDLWIDEEDPFFDYQLEQAERRVINNE